MEYFERAHVAKDKHAGDRTQKKVKKQIKQMLIGYKQSDNDLIKYSAKINSDSDSSSVSGFSDLDLTSNEDHSDDFTDSRDVSLSVDTGRTLDSLSDCKDELQSLSEGSQVSNITHDSDTHSLLDSASITSSLTDSNDPLTFDVDGTLAFTIHDKLNKVRKTDNVAGVKINKIDTELDTDTSVKYKEPLYKIEEESEKSYASDISKVLDSDGEDTDLSQPYVSVTVNNMPMVSLNSTIGYYKHSTVRNLPYENIISVGTTDLFTVENASDTEVNALNSIQEDELVEFVSSEGEETMDIDESDMYQNTSSLERQNNTSIYDSASINDNTLLTESSDRAISPDSFEPQTEFVKPVLVHFAKDAVVVIMRHPSEFYIHGKVKMTALGGKMEICGYTLLNETVKVFAPKYNFAQCVKTLPGENEYYGLFGKLTKSGLSVAVAEEILTTLGPEDGVLCLQPLKSKKLEFIDLNFTAADLFTKTNKNVDECFRKASEVLGCSLYLARPWRAFEENPSWPEVLKCGFEVRSKGIICGGKGLGKSNFLRYYVNKMLSQGPVLVIDLDPGQAEFTVAGNISATVVTEPLLGPAFTHLQTPEITFNIGMISTMDNPRRYITAIDTLLRHCAMSEEFKDLPWIVNTMGMVNGLGLKFISYIILQIQPSFVLQIDSKNPKKKFEVHLTSKDITELYRTKLCFDRMFGNILSEDLNYKFILTSHAEITVKNNASLAPRDERYLNFLAYFSELIASSNKAGLLEIVPYEVNIRDFNIVLNVKIDKEAIWKVLNAKVVALCEEKLFDKTGNVFTMNDKPILCHGHGLIRGIDKEKAKLYLVTPAPINSLAKVNCIVYADWVPEIRGQEKYLPEGVQIPYRTSTEYHQRQLILAPKRRFNPVQLIKMSRNT